VQSANTWHAAAVAFAVLPVLEMALPEDTANPTAAAARAKMHSVWFKLPLCLWLPAQSAALLAAAWAGPCTMSKQPGRGMRRVCTGTLVHYEQSKQSGNESASGQAKEENAASVLGYKGW
jgi:hypothetical protein